MTKCPTCGSTDVGLAETDNGFFVVACGTCGMCGAEQPNPDDAKRLWEILCGSVCTHCRKNLIIHYNQRIKELKAEIVRLKGEEHDCDSRNPEKDAE